MYGILNKALLAASLSTAALIGYAAPVALTDEQLDQVAAGGQYAFVDGAASADTGSVLVRADTSAFTKKNGTSVTKASLKVLAVGTGLEGYGYGESGANGVVSAVYGEGAVDAGKLVIRVKTVSKVRADGDVVTKSKVQVKAVERDNVRVPVGVARAL